MVFAAEIAKIVNARDIHPAFAKPMCLLHNVNQIYLKRLDCSLNRIGIVVKS